MSTLRSMFEHMAWADERAVAMVAASPDVARDSGAHRFLGHIVAAERVWLLRITGADSSTHPIWPDWSLERVRSTAEENAQAYRELIANASEEDLTRLVEYRNSQGVAFRTAVADILAQVLLHGSYHRGQIALALRTGSLAPMNTDYITYVREQH